MKVCDVCRASNEPEAEFCGTCGSRLPAATPATQTPDAAASDDASKATSGDATGDSATPEAVGTATEVVPVAADDDTVVPGSKKPKGSKAQRAAHTKPDGPAGSTEAGGIAGTTQTPLPPPPWNTAKPAPTPMVTCQVCRTENDVLCFAALAFMLYRVARRKVA